MIKITKMLLDDFAYEEFICADFKTEYVSKSIIILRSEQTSVKDCKESFTKKNVKMIITSDDSFSLNKKVIYKNDYRKTHTENINSIGIDKDDLQLESLVKQNYQGIHSEKHESIYIFTDDIRHESQITRNDHSDYKKVTKYRNNIRSTILKKIMNILLKQVRKNADKY